MDGNYLGEIVRLQVQIASLKVGERGHRHFDPSPIRSLSSIQLSEGGVMGEDVNGEPIVDVHHRDHPVSKNSKGKNGISVLFTSHYDLMRRQFGDHIGDGIAGESILVACARQVSQDDLQRGLIVVTTQGSQAHLRDFLVAEPCVEFTGFALGGGGAEPSNREVAAALPALRAGMRGFYARFDGDATTVSIGDAVYFPATQ